MREIDDAIAATAGVRERIARAASAAGRDPDAITLVAVSKGVDDARLAAYLRAGGGPDLGENRTAELAAKRAALDPLGPRWHFIGALQRNKVKAVAGTVALIHSVESAPLAVAIARVARAREQIQDVLLEVNTSGEASKHGVVPAGAAELADQVAALEGVRLRGLMTMAPEGDLDAARACFRRLRALGERIGAAHPDAVELSMGMSGDLDVAVDEGATIVRVGTAIFGPRRAR